MAQLRGIGFKDRNFWGFFPSEKVPKNILGRRWPRLPHNLNSISMPDMPALQEKSRKPNFENRVAPEIEDAVVKTAQEYPAYGQLRASNELRKIGIIISNCGVRSIW
jgi:hypothetical protein